MSDMKCPICNDGKIITYLDGTYECDNPECSIYNGTHTETFEALIRTRKALEIAVDALRRANNTYCAEEEDITIDLTESAAHKWQRTAYQMEMPISIALEQITALE